LSILAISVVLIAGSLAVNPIAIADDDDGDDDDDEGGSGTGISCDWVGDKIVNRFFQCEAIAITCTNGQVTNMRFVPCPP